MIRKLNMLLPYKKLNKIAFCNDNPSFIFLNLQPFQILIGMTNLITLNYDQYKFIYKICESDMSKILNVNVRQLNYFI